MNTIIKLTVFLFFTISFSYAQNPLSREVQTEFGMGISLPFLHTGTELMQSSAIRENDQSYFSDDSGNRRNVGSYGNLVGWAIAIAYYIPVKRVNGLMLGTAVRTSLTGSQPQMGGYEEAYFFNFLSFGLAAKYYPFTQNNLFIKVDGGLASVFTKNRYLDEQNRQNFFHQFGIGTNISAALGYSIQAFKDKSRTLDVQLIYQYNSARVEVNSLGDDQWGYSALTLMGAINF